MIHVIGIVTVLLRQKYNGICMMIDVVLHQMGMDDHRFAEEDHLMLMVPHDNNTADLIHAIHAVLILEDDLPRNNNHMIHVDHLHEAIHSQ
jgi:hypothetical protein